MLYNGFVITDNRAFSDPNIPSSDKWNPNKLESSYNEESGVYTTPAGPGGGGSTPPTLPAGWSIGSGGAPAPSAPKTGSGGGGNWQQWLTPETIGAVAGTVGAVAGSINQNPDKQRIKAACGRKPLFNTGGKKDAYNQCVQNLLAPPVIQQRMDMPQQGMSTTTKIMIGALAFLLLAAVVIMIIVLSKRSKTA